jgi:hypothetical protein
VHERWRAETVLRLPRAARAFGLSWRELHNRAERTRIDPRTGGVECLWPDSSVLTTTRVFPSVGVRLLRHVLREWPIDLEAGACATLPDEPAVSILIPIGGASRLAQFELALSAARAQEGIACEIVVVEQSRVPTLSGGLPADVRYVHQVQDGALAFKKSSALNHAAREAKGEYLIILDADYLLPTRFAAECCRVLRDVESVRPARLLFYLDEASTVAMSAHLDPFQITGIEKVVANNPTPIAVRRSTYWQIGGHDEGYVGWGGEDSEFLDRLRTLPICEAGWMPVMHAWHAPAPKKADGDRNRQFHASRMAVPASTRIGMAAALAKDRVE